MAAQKKAAIKKVVAKKVAAKKVRANKVTGSLPVNDPHYGSGANLPAARPVTEAVDVQARIALGFVGRALEGLSGLDSNAQAGVDVALASIRRL